MNYIVLEGISLYLVLVLTVLLLAISTISLICTVLSDKRIHILETLLYKESEKVKYLSKKIFVLQIKNGDIDIDEK